MNVQSFTPGAGSGANLVLSASNSSSAVTMPTGHAVWRVVNAGTANIAFRITKGVSTSVFANDTVMLAGTVELFGVPVDADNFTAITASGTSTVYVTAGEGA